MDNQKITTASIEFVNYVKNNLPQISPDGKVNYYFSGSILIPLLSQTKEIDFLKVNKQGLSMQKYNKNIEMNENARECFNSGIRMLGDIDIIDVDNFFAPTRNVASRLKFDNPQEYAKLYEKKQSVENVLSTKNVYSNCPNIGDFLKSKSEKFNIPEISIFDNLADNRDINAHHLAKIKLNNDCCIFIVNPVDQFAHKVADSVYYVDNPKLKQNPSWFNKHFSDLKTYLSGLLEMNAFPEDFSSYVEEIINNTDSIISDVFKFGDIQEHLEFLEENIINRLNEKHHPKTKVIFNQLKQLNSKLYQPTTESQPE